jgi:hypothetical protein
MAIKYDKAGSKCVGGPKPGTSILERRILLAFEGARSGGIYNCRNVRGAKSPSLHGEGRALDIFPLSKLQGDLIAQWCVLNARDYQIQEVIWYERIWSSNKALQGFRKYTGQANHHDHVHIGQNWSGANSDFAHVDPPVSSLRRQEFL